MIKFAVYTDNEWLYPDSELGAKTKAELYAARNGDVCFQVLTDYELEQGENIEYELNANDETVDLGGREIPAVLFNATEKSLKDLGDKVDSKDREKAEEQIKELKEALEKDDIEDIKSKTEKLNETAMAFATKGDLVGGETTIFSKPSFSCTYSSNSISTLSPLKFKEFGNGLLVLYTGGKESLSPPVGP